MPSASWLSSSDAAIRFGTRGLPDDGISEEARLIGGVATRVRFSPGSGPTLVLLPGSMLDSSLLTWKRTLENLPPHVRCLVPDLPGYGRSAFPAGADCSTAYYARWIGDLADAYDLDRFALGGSSMSAAVALAFALDQPQRLTHLVLSGAYGLAPRLPMHRLVYALSRVPDVGRIARVLLRRAPGLLRLGLHVATASLRVPADLMDDAREGLVGSRALEAFARWLRLELTPDGLVSHLAPRLPSLRVPTLLVHGTRDALVPYRYAERASSLLPGGRLLTLAGSGHLGPRERDATVSAALHAFLRLSES
jgi:pimeloyl-ACP methyl ester carboxylesterase